MRGSVEMLAYLLSDLTLQLESSLFHFSSLCLDLICRIVEKKNKTHTHAHARKCI